jgi:outer membrane immunogenic protein
MIRKFLLAATALVVVTGSALAADLPSRKAPPVFAPPPPIFTWTGVYIGGQVGYAWGQSSNRVIGTGFAQGDSPEGVIGGAHVGYNYQIQQFVFGLEGDVDGSSYSKSVFDVGTGTTFGTRIPIEGSARGRIGYAWDRTLLYATGGAAFADLHHTYAGAFNPAAPFLSTSTGKVGWTVGGGVEYAVTNNWSVRAEYRYSDFGRTTDAVGSGVVSHKDTEHAVRVGFSYKFDMYAPPAPVLAKY